MSLRAVFAQAASAAFAAFGDVIETVTYNSNVGNPTYNAATGEPTFTSSSSESVQMAFTYFRRNEIDNLNVLSSDIKGICRQAELTAAPRVGDTVVRGGQTYRVEYFNQDPAGATWKFKLRKG